MTRNRIIFKLISSFLLITFSFQQVSYAKLHINLGTSAHNDEIELPGELDEPEFKIVQAITTNPTIRAILEKTEVHDKSGAIDSLRDLFTGTSDTSETTSWLTSCGMSNADAEICIATVEVLDIPDTAPKPLRSRLVTDPSIIVTYAVNNLTADILHLPLGSESQKPTGVISAKPGISVDPNVIYLTEAYREFAEAMGFELDAMNRVVTTGLSKLRFIKNRRTEAELKAAFREFIYLHEIGHDVAKRLLDGVFTSEEEEIFCNLFAKITLGLENSITPEESAIRDRVREQYGTPLGWAALAKPDEQVFSIVEEAFLIGIFSQNPNIRYNPGADEDNLLTALALIEIDCAAPGAMTHLEPNLSSVNKEAMDTLAEEGKLRSMTSKDSTPQPVITADRAGVLLTKSGITDMVSRRFSSDGPRGVCTDALIKLCTGEMTLATTLDQLQVYVSFDTASSWASDSAKLADREKERLQKILALPEPNVLIVNKDHVSNTLLTHHLTQNGYHVVAQRSPDAGLAQLKSGRFDLVITDLQFGTDTKAATRMIDEIESSETPIPVIVRTTALLVPTETAKKVDTVVDINERMTTVMACVSELVPTDIESGTKDQEQPTTGKAGPVYAFTEPASSTPIITSGFDAMLKRIAQDAHVVLNRGQLFDIFESQDTITPGDVIANVIGDKPDDFQGTVISIMDSRLERVKPKEEREVGHGPLVSARTKTQKRPPLQGTLLSLQDRRSLQQTTTYDFSALSDDQATALLRKLSALGLDFDEVRLMELASGTDVTVSNVIATCKVEPKSTVGARAKVAHVLDEEFSQTDQSEQPLYNFPQHENVVNIIATELERAAGPGTTVNRMALGKLEQTATLNQILDCFVERPESNIDAIISALDTQLGRVDTERGGGLHALERTDADGNIHRFGYYAPYAVLLAQPNGKTLHTLRSGIWLDKSLTEKVFGDKLGENKSLPGICERFTLAHEIAHMFLLKKLKGLLHLLEIDTEDFSDVFAAASVVSLMDGGIESNRREIFLGMLDEKQEHVRKSLMTFLTKHSPERERMLEGTYAGVDKNALQLLFDVLSCRTGFAKKEPDPLRELYKTDNYEMTPSLQIALFRLDIPYTYGTTDLTFNGNMQIIEAFNRAVADTELALYPMTRESEDKPHKPKAGFLQYWDGEISGNASLVMKIRRAMEGKVSEPRLEAAAKKLRYVCEYAGTGQSADWRSSSKTYLAETQKLIKPDMVDDLIKAAHVFGIIKKVENGTLSMDQLDEEMNQRFATLRSEDNPQNNVMNGRHLEAQEIAFGVIGANIVQEDQEIIIVEDWLKGFGPTIEKDIRDAAAKSNTIRILERNAAIEHFTRPPDGTRRALLSDNVNPQILSLVNVVRERDDLTVVTADRYEALHLPAIVGLARSVLAKDARGIRYFSAILNNGQELQAQLLETWLQGGWISAMISKIEIEQLDSVEQGGIIREYAKLAESA